MRVLLLLYTVGLGCSLKILDYDMWKMVKPTCDDGRTNLSVDWDMNSRDYECEDRHSTSDTPILETDTALNATIEQEQIPPNYVPTHYCMIAKLKYNRSLPTWGPHRPAWAKNGEYTFLPVQRFLHNLEHGAVVFLYHPCARPSMVSHLKNTVKSCLYRHVISASRLIWPFALLAWGWRMLMPTVDTELALKFILEHTLHGPEKISADGFYDQLLERVQLLLRWSLHQMTRSYVQTTRSCDFN